MINDEIGQQMSVEACHMHLEESSFFIHSFNMDISLIMALIFLKTCMYMLLKCIWKEASQNFDIGFSFCFMLCRRSN